MPDKPNRVRRLLRLITVLQRGRGTSAAGLCVELGISRRTLFRDLDALRDAGIPVYHKRGEGYRINHGFYLPPVNLTMPEALGLMLLGKSAAAQRDRPLVAPALSAIYKLITTVPEPIRSACSEVMTHVSVDPGASIPGDTEMRWYPVLQKCIDTQTACDIAYTSPAGGDRTLLETRLEPYALHFANRAWYVLGKTAAHKEVRVLKLARFERIEPSTKQFKRPAGFTVDKKLGNAWQLIPGGKEYHVELEFTPLVATNVSEVRWHATQEHEVLPDGRCRMRFCVDGLNEIAWWVCGYADQVKVLKPKALRDKVKAMHRSAAAQ